MKKKVISALLCAAMVSTMLIGCGSTDEKETSTETPKKAETTKEEPKTTEEPAKTEDDKASTTASGDYSDVSIEIVAKGFQHDFWKAVKLGSEKAQKDLGLKSTNFVGPANESAVAEQIEQINNAVNKAPSAIVLAALDTQASLDVIKNAQAAGIPIVGFDSGVPDAPAGAIVANAATNNYAAGELAAEKMFELIKDKVTNPTDTVRIGVLSQDATSQSITERTSGFVEKMCKLIGEDKTAVEGHDKYNKKVEGAKVVLDVGIPATTNDADGVTVANTLLNKEDIIAMYGSNEFAAKCMITSNESLQKLGADKVIGVGFDSGTIQAQAVRDGILSGSITQDPVSIGYKAVEMAAKAAKGEKVEDIDTGCLWYDKDNMDSEQIAPCLYKG